jgi:hypothetical protein
MSYGLREYEYETDKPEIGAFLKRKGISSEDIQAYKKVVDLLREQIREQKITRKDILLYQKVISVLRKWYLKPSWERETRL